MERWLTIQEHPNYEISNHGIVRNKLNGHILKPVLNRKGGYYRVRLDKTRYYVHRLVVDTFFDGDHKDLNVNHVDGNHLNNNISNLEWRAKRENKESFKVEVVRCKDCVHRNNNDFCASRPDEFFCADGERDG